jgi:hypothetical protein
MDILTNNKIELTCDDYKLDYVMTVYDAHGHYIDEIKLTKEEIKDLYMALNKLNL